MEGSSINESLIRTIPNLLHATCDHVIMRLLQYKVWWRETSNTKGSREIHGRKNRG